jgi:hypothetical protein
MSPIVNDPKNQTLYPVRSLSGSGPDLQGSGSCESPASYRYSSPKIAATAFDFFQDVRVLSDGGRRSSLGLDQYWGRFHKEKLAQKEFVRGSSGGFYLFSLRDLSYLVAFPNNVVDVIERIASDYVYPEDTC